jgi:hypothetical protein
MLDCSPEHPHLAEMADAMRLVFDNTQKFHTTQFQNLAAGIIKEQISLDNFSPEEKQWRMQLKVDDRVDVLKEDKEYRVTEWSRGVIKRVVPDP